MKKTITILTTIFIFALFSNLFAADIITEYDIFRADEKSRTAVDEEGWLDKPSWPFFYVAPFMTVPTMWEHSLFAFDFSFSIIDTCAIRMGEFITFIKQDEELFAKLEFASPDTANQYFAFGIGYIEALGSKNAFVEYGIDKTRPICFVARITRHNGDWDFCYSYADEEITELTCHSFTVGISEPSSIGATLLISPNPANASTTVITVIVGLETAGNLTITLNNMLGQELFEIHNDFTVEGNFFIRTFSIATLPTGVYYLRVVHNGNVRVEKVIKQ